MCGIAGIFNLGTPTPESVGSALRSLQTSLRHRGPDDEGVWMSPDGKAGLVHTRLSILDLSTAGHQPMAAVDDALCIVFNGEIYNFRELRSELERKGRSFRTGTDTEVLLQLYACEGPAMVKRLRGMFAFAIWDAKDRKVFLARDPLGIKPLYYTLTDGRLAFASEVKSLQRAGLAGSALNGRSLVRFLESGSVPEPDTLLRDVRCLRAGHSLTWQGGMVEEGSFWQLSFDAEEVGATESVARTREALLDSVRHHFISDVPVGVFLSGGIDSTALVALARAVGQTQLETFSVGVDDEGLDESSIARDTARHFSTRHHELRLDGARAAMSFPRFLECMDQPSVDGLNTFMVSGFAREQGMKVVLSGLGGDEMFGGYPSFEKVPQLASMARALHRVPGAAAVVGSALERFGHRQPLRRLGGYLRGRPTMRRAYGAFRGMFSSKDARALVERYMGCSFEVEDDEPSLGEADVRDQVSALELSLYMRNQLLKDSDVMSMANGLELRVPLVDRVLFEAVAGIPANLRLRRGKQLLLEAVPEIPGWVANQPKRGFVFPYEKWLAAEWGQDFAKVKAALPGPNPTWYQCWCVFMLERWLERR
jgi:asparagine synthase (glutamine-hydrolysing)